MSGGMIMKQLPKVKEFESPEMEENEEESVSAKLDVIQELLQKLSGGFANRIQSKKKPAVMSVEIMSAKPKEVG